MPLFMLFFISSFLALFLVLIGLHIRKMMKLKDERCKELSVNPAITELPEIGNGFGSTTISGKTRE